MHGALPIFGLAFAVAGLASGAAAQFTDQADYQAGERLYRECRTCHQVGEDARHHTGPHLNDLFGRRAGTMEGYRYSEEMRHSSIVWDAETLEAFIADPRGYMPGTRMTYRGMEERQNRLDLIAYLQRFDALEAVTGLAPAVQAILDVEPDVAYGEYLSSECSACHAASAEGGIPVIAGQPAETFVTGILDYRSGQRSHPVMEMIAKRLGDEEIAALAAYFEGQMP